MTENDYQNVLLAVSGLTPQIITETLYGLVVEKEIPVHKVHVITTSIGKDKIDKLLLANGEGKLYEFAREYQLRAEDYVPEIHLIQDEAGCELEDIRTKRDNEVAANFIVRIVRELAGNPNTKIIASVAGGRKTMSVYLGYALQLFGRVQDVLTHVLIQPQSVESNADFFYIPKQKGPLRLKRKERNGTFTEFEVPIGDLKIELAEIPFIRLRGLLLHENLDRFHSFTEIVRETQAALDSAHFPPKMKVDLKQAVVEIRDISRIYKVKLKPQEMALYYYLAGGQELLNSNRNLKGEIPKILKTIYEKYFPVGRISASSFNKDAVQSLRSNINRRIMQVVDNPRIVEQVKIQSHRTSEGAVYFIPLESTSIELHPQNV